MQDYPKQFAWDLDLEFVPRREDIHQRKGTKYGWTFPTNRRPSQTLTHFRKTIEIDPASFAVFRWTDSSLRCSHHHRNEQVESLKPKYCNKWQFQIWTNNA